MVQSASSSYTAPNVYIDGVMMPTPSILEVGIQDVDFDAGRTADGTMHRNRVATKRKLKVGWPPLPIVKKDGSKPMSTILQAVSPDSFTVVYYDPQLGSMASGTFYCGDRIAPMFNYAVGLYDAISFDMVEF